MNQLVSIIVPVYKTEQYLRRCVESIQRQTYESVEIILVDDGSPDTSGELCDNLAREDCRIRVIHKQNGGLSSARNAGIEVARGEYICFVDSDDFIHENYVSTLCKIVTQYQADIAKIDYMEVYSSEQVNKKGRNTIHLYQGLEVERAFFDLKVDSACVLLYTREIINDIRFPEGKTSEDIPFNFAVFQQAKRFVYMKSYLYFYYHNPDSISNGRLDRNMFNYLDFRREIYQSYLEGNDSYIKTKAEALYARAAMGLLTRMALYGVDVDINEEETKSSLKKIFIEHQRAFFSDTGVPLSRKGIAVCTVYLYSLTKCLRGRFK